MMASMGMISGIYGSSGYMRELHQSSAEMKRQMRKDRREMRRLRRAVARVKARVGVQPATEVMSASHDRSGTLGSLGNKKP